MDVFILNENGTDAARAGLFRLHDAVGRRESGRPEAALSPEELLARFRAADPTRNGACLPWLLRTYAAGGYRLEDLSKAYDTLAAFARLRGQLPNTATIDGETRNPRKLGSHITLASLWTVIVPLIEVERLEQEEEAGEQADADKERALSQSRVLHRSNRMVIAVPMTQEASCWWGQGTQWCTAARKNNVFERYHSKAPLIVICLRRVGDLPARKIQLYVHAGDMQFMDENDARVSPEIILERWQDLKVLLYWATARNMEALAYVPEHLLTEEICSAAVSRNGFALSYVPMHLRTEAMCLAAVTQDGEAMRYVPEHLRTEAICSTAVTNYGQALKYVPEHLRTEAVCLAAVTQNGWALDCVPGPLCTESICTVAVGRNGGSLKYVPNHLRTEAVCLAAVGENGEALAHVSKPLCTEEMCLAAVGSNGLALEYVPEYLYMEAICLAAVGSNGRALDHVPKHLRTEALCMAAVTQEAAALYHVPEPLRTEAMCLVAVMQNAAVLRHVPDRLRTEAVYLAAVGSNGWVLEHVPEHLRTEAICLAAVTHYGRGLKHVPEHLRTEVICLAAVGSNGCALPHVPEHLRTEAMRLVAVGSNERESARVTGDDNNWELNDLVLSNLEGCLKNSQPSHQNTGLVINV